MILAQVFSCEFREIFNSTFFPKYLRATDSVLVLNLSHTFFEYLAVDLFRCWIKSYIIIFLEAVTQWCSAKKLFWNDSQIHRKPPVIESLFYFNHWPTDEKDSTICFHMNFEELFNLVVLQNTSRFITQHLNVYKTYDLLFG